MTKTNSTKDLETRGRHRKDGDAKAVKKTVSLRLATQQYLLEVGEGVLSEGVERVALFHQRYGFHKQKGTPDA